MVRMFVVDKLDRIVLLRPMSHALGTLPESGLGSNVFLYHKLQLLVLGDTSGSMSA